MFVDQKSFSTGKNNRKMQQNKEIGNNWLTAGILRITSGARKIMVDNADIEISPCGFPSLS